MARVSAQRVTQHRDPVERSWLDAVDAGDEHTAAGLYLRAKRDANDRSMPAGARQEARHTMSAIVERFPNARQVAADAADHELGIEGDPDLKGVRDQHRTDVGVTAQGAANARRRRTSGEGPRNTGRGRGGAQRGRTAPQRPRPRTARPSRSRGSRGLWRNRYVRQTGIPGAASSATAFGLQLLGLMLGLSLLYLVLTRAETGKGWQFFEQGLGSVTNAAVNLIDYRVDPLARRDTAANQAAVRIQQGGVNVTAHDVVRARPLSPTPVRPRTIK